MAISDELTRIQNAKSALKTSIENKGVTVSDSTLLSGYSALVDQIQTGGGGGNEDLIDLIERDFTTFNIPSGTTSIGQYVFYGCNSLTSVTIPSGVTSIGEGAFFDCTNLTSVTIPSGVTSIGVGVFRNCRKLSSVTIPSSVTIIDTYAFQSCSGLTSVIIGSGITSFGQNAFNGCSGLTSLTIEATTPPTLGYNAFAYNASGRKIYVPAASVETYKAASGWSTYAADIEAIPSE